MFCIYLLFSLKKLNFSLSIKNAEIIHHVSSNKVQVPGTNKFVNNSSLNDINNESSASLTPWSKVLYHGLHEACDIETHS